MQYKYIKFFLFILLISIKPVTGYAGDNTLKSFSKEFRHLKDIATGKTSKLDDKLIEPLIAYAASNTFKSAPDYYGALKKTPSAYHGFKLKASMKEYLKFFCNSEIPGSAVSPEHIRLTSWKSIATPSCKNGSELWELVDTFKSPVIKKGIQYLQNTPDVNTGAYYGYESWKSWILMKYKGKNVMIAITKQKDTSEVGKKGFILGKNKNLDFFYSGEPGLNKLGCGRVKSYLYDAFSIIVYVETGNDMLQCSTFKWLKGGWAGLNVIKPHHIKKGLERVAKNRTKIFETNTLPLYDKLIAACSRYNLLSEKEMKLRMKNNLNRMILTCGSLSKCPPMINKRFNPDDYISKMTKEELRASLLLEDVKSLYIEKRQQCLKLSVNKNS